MKSMALARHAWLELPAEMALIRSPDKASGAAALRPITVTCHEDLQTIEQDWRRFEREADCTAFQTFDWLATWQRCIGTRRAVTPAVVVGRDADGNILFVLPLAVERTGLLRRLTWLGSELCDYNAPLLAPHFSREVNADRFLLLWQDVKHLLQSRRHLRFDLIDLEKMPQTVGAQTNPLLHLGGTLHPNGAYLAHLGTNWDEFYAAKRSSATRRRDRTKRKRLSDHGAIAFVSPNDPAEIASTLDTLISQKTKSFLRMGVANIFARPGQREFYLALATDPATRHLAHVSRLDVGTTVAAVNLGLTFRDCYYHILASYTDSDMARLGPGAAHLHELLRDAIDRGFRRFDFTIGDERYKRDWCDTELKLYDHIEAATVLGGAAANLSYAARRLKRLVKQTPLLWQTFSKGRAVFGSLAKRQAASAEIDDNRVPPEDCPPTSPR
jgi:CelD/BcsL family acetyltransferase involved in cellulose biosynthesis